MTPINGEKVTISDCGKALDEIDREMTKLHLQLKEIERKREALRTQARIIQELVRHLA